MKRAETVRPGVERLQDAVEVFNGAERRLRVRYHRLGESLSHGHLRALFLLMAEREATAGRLARESGLTPASVTAMLDQLESRGLVQRRRDEQDRRVCRVSLTDRGRAEVAEKKARWSERLASAFADVPDGDLEAASRVLERLAAVLDEQYMLDRDEETEAPPPP